MQHNLVPTLAYHLELAKIIVITKSWHVLHLNSEIHLRWDDA